MKLALKLAERGRFTTSPNPMVGACVVHRGRLVGQGYHKRYGGEHAEVNALKDAGRKTKGAILYVTLEPCASWGKTPPCVMEILRAGIRQVVVGSLDPNLLNHKKGVNALRKEGVRVTIGVLAREIEKQNQAFFKWTRKKLPFVTLKMAQSLDGKIANSRGESRWISSAVSRHFVHRLRSEQDGILIGKNTLLMDDPLLSPRVSSHLESSPTKWRRKKEGVPEKPWRIVLDPQLQASKKARIFQGDQLTLIAVAKQNLVKLQAQKQLPSVTLLPVHEVKGRLDVKDLLTQLARLGVAKLLIEGGGELAWSVLDAGLVDRMVWIVAPKIIGGRLAKTSVEGKGIRDLSKAIQCRNMKVSRLGEDWLFEARP